MLSAKIVSTTLLLSHDLLHDHVTFLHSHMTRDVSFLQRVMASGFFILLRFFMRVDGLLIRMNDTRIYHEVNYVLLTIHNEIIHNFLQLPLTPSKVLEK